MAVMQFIHYKVKMALAFLKNRRYINGRSTRIQRREINKHCQLACSNDFLREVSYNQYRGCVIPHEKNSYPETL